MREVRYWQYTVEGSGRFPIDMLRYDRSYPRGEQDSVVIDQDRSEVTFYKEVREVTLIHQDDGYGNHWEPNIERWKSFTWKVIQMAEME